MLGIERQLRGFGQFADHRRLPPQDLQPALTGGFLEQLMGDPGIRLARPTGRQVHYAGDRTFHTFVRGPAPPNAPEEIELAPYTAAATFRRSLGRHRGGGI